VLAPLFPFCRARASEARGKKEGSILFAEKRRGEVLDGFDSDHGVQLYPIERADLRWETRVARGWRHSSVGDQEEGERGEGEGGDSGGGWCSCLRWGICTSRTGRPTCPPNSSPCSCPARSNTSSALATSASR